MADKISFLFFSFHSVALSLSHHLSLALSQSFTFKIFIQFDMSESLECETRNPSRIDLFAVRRFYDSICFISSHWESEIKNDDETQINVSTLKRVRVRVYARATRKKNEEKISSSEQIESEVDWKWIQHMYVYQYGCTFTLKTCTLIKYYKNIELLLWTSMNEQHQYYVARY